MGTSAGRFISEPGSDQKTTPTGSAPRIVDVACKPNIKAIEVIFDQFPAGLWNEKWEMYVDNQKMPVAAPQGSPNARPNAAMDQHPTGVLIGTLPWLSSLDATDFPCCGTIKFCIPGMMSCISSLLIWLLSTAISIIFRIFFAQKHKYDRFILVSVNASILHKETKPKI